MCATFVLFAALSDAQLHTKFGVLNGNALENGVTEFLGVPYAPQPERWTEAQPWTAPYAGGSWDATAHGRDCLRASNHGHGSQWSGSEDCHNLNLWLPSGGVNTTTPLMVWIHGGGLSYGSGNDDKFNGTQLAAREGALVVTLNYRLQRSILLLSRS